MLEYLTTAEHAWSLAYSANQAFNDMMTARFDEVRLRKIDELGIPGVAVRASTYNELTVQHDQAAYEFGTMVDMIPLRQDSPFTPRHPERQWYETRPTLPLRPSALKVSRLVDFEISLEVAQAEFTPPALDKRFDLPITKVTHNLPEPKEVAYALGILDKVHVPTLRCMLAIGRTPLLKEVRGMSPKRINRLADLVYTIDSETHWHQQPTMQDVVRLYPRFSEIPRGVLERGLPRSVHGDDGLHTIGDVLTKTTQVIKPYYQRSDDPAEGTAQLISKAILFTKDYFAALEEMTATPPDPSRR